MSYQANLELKISSFPGPMTAAEVEKLCAELKRELQEFTEIFLEKKFLNVPSLRIHGPSIVYLTD